MNLERSLTSNIGSIAMAIFKRPWTTRKELEEVRREEQRVRDELGHQKHLEWQREQDKRDLQERLKRETEKLARERQDRAEYEAKVKEQHEIQERNHREEKAKRDELLRQEQELRDQERRRALEQERRLQDEQPHQKVRAQQKRLARIQQLRTINPDSLYRLRELIRQRYALDVEIWSYRRVRRVDRGIVEDLMAKADAVLVEIQAMVTAWQGTEKLWTGPEWIKAQEIRDRLLADGKRQWLSNPPWNDE
ncbi:hypothetical protein FKW77_000194 [Venturia effusa]|uniref:Uncharacterized protein n=1 Tax=Venturia effusa TaxID=50376 RepID=A0A517L2I6_9PEZI|nr:hypothetical protein FKW77_000194 [Venturia effusa]